MTGLTQNRFHSFPSFVREFDELFRDAQRNQAFLPATDIRELPQGIEIHLDVPGIKPEDIDLQVEGNVLTVRATRKQDTTENKEGWVRRERVFGELVRSFTLASSLDGSKPEASYKHGVLTVAIPKKQDVLPKTFKVKVSEST